MQVWRLQKTTDGGNIADICLSENVVAMGWALGPERERKLMKDPRFERYYELGKDDPLLKNYTSVRRMAVETKEGDIIWMRHEGQYYFARVSKDSRWYYDFSKEARDTDTTNRLSNIYWHKASDKADESSVPGSLTTGFIRGSTYQRINKPGINEYSQMLYNMRAAGGEVDKYHPKIELSEEWFWNLLQPDDAEDLLCLWLYSEKGYVVIPSTNKRSTELYECVLLDPNVGERTHIYVQVKKGDETIDASKYEGLDGDTYFLATRGKVINVNPKKHHVVDSKTLYEFAIDEKNAALIPEGIAHWIKFLSESENETMDKSKAKGIMIDTNRAYSDVNELEMLSQNRVCAYGDADRYIRSFRKGDYALFYAKGKGVIAIGQVTSDKPGKVETEKGLYHEVKMLVPENGDYSCVEDRYVSAREIKELLHRGFYFASTIKTPFLNAAQVEKIAGALIKKYE